MHDRDESELYNGKVDLPALTLLADHWSGDKPLPWRVVRVNTSGDKFSGYAEIYAANDSLVGTFEAFRDFRPIDLLVSALNLYGSR